MLAGAIAIADAAAVHLAAHVHHRQNFDPLRRPPLNKPIRRLEEFPDVSADQLGNHPARIREATRLIQATHNPVNHFSA